LVPTLVLETKAIFVRDSLWIELLVKTNQDKENEEEGDSIITYFLIVPYITLW
jgi:hypothetical protein